MNWKPAYLRYTLLAKANLSGILSVVFGAASILVSWLYIPALVTIPVSLVSAVISVELHGTKALPIIGITLSLIAILIIRLRWHSLSTATY